MIPRKLIIATGNKVIGKVTEVSDTFTFEYEETWVSQKDSFDLSPKFKRTVMTHTGNKVKNFLENLLPENSIREKIADQNKTDVKDIVRLLEITGRDSAGALQVYSEKDFDDLIYDPNSVHEIHISDLAKEIKSSGTVINYITKIGLKPSLSGAQDKIACRYDSKTGIVSLPLSGGATTHIIKPSGVANNRESKALEKSALNEFVALRLAEKVLKNVPKTHFFESRDRDLFIIDRYDRVISGNDIKRIHQFDFCQYFGIRSADKYEISESGTRKGQYGIWEILKAIAEESEESRDKEHLLDWVVFNYLIENTDSHLKNVSMIATDTGFKLAPFYDMTIVGFYKFNGINLYDNYFAFDVGGVSKMNDLCDHHWRGLSSKLELGSDFFLEKIKSLSREISKNLAIVYSEIEKEIQDKSRQRDVEKILKFIGISIETKSYRCLINSSVKSNRNICSICGKEINPNKCVLGIGPECLKKLKR